MTAGMFQMQVLQTGFVDKAAQLQSLQQQLSGRSTPDPEVSALQRQLQQMQVHLLFLQLMVLALHDALSLWWCAAISQRMVCCCINIIRCVYPLQFELIALKGRSSSCTYLAHGELQSIEFVCIMVNVLFCSSWHFVCNHRWKSDNVQSLMCWLTL